MSYLQCAHTAHVHTFPVQQTLNKKKKLRLSCETEYSPKAFFSTVNKKVCACFLFSGIDDVETGLCLYRLFNPEVWVKP